MFLLIIFPFYFCFVNLHQFFLFLLFINKIICHLFLPLNSQRNGTFFSYIIFAKMKKKNFAQQKHLKKLKQKKV